MRTINPFRVGLLTEIFVAQKYNLSINSGPKQRSARRSGRLRAACCALKNWPPSNRDSQRADWLLPAYSYVQNPNSVSKNLELLKAAQSPSCALAEDPWATQALGHASAWRGERSRHRREVSGQSPLIPNPRRSMQHFKGTSICNTCRTCISSDSTSMV
jgi:hypothetical protein